ncbi:hypothetical protein CWO85_00440 [Candidatus Phytoplasma ziziphi]|uniref:Uncharacterized protein n=1 Tax=Ziziphus jujuba witches'-broom phytoplasma TaxID=135727 RepID=A0A660HLT4_ZIZJU|nr:hypothetical protein CWO85_00440 [Candidatus Phytoplasma ziziphi]
MEIETLKLIIEIFIAISLFMDVIIYFKFLKRVRKNEKEIILINQNLFKLFNLTDEQLKNTLIKIEIIDRRSNKK